MYKRNKIIILISFILLLIFSQWLMVKLVYSHKLGIGPSKFFAKVYNLKMGVIEDADSKDINIYLNDFFKHKAFVNKLAQSQSTSKEDNDIIIDDEEVLGLVWDKLLRQAWLARIAEENDIEVNQEDLDYYINTIVGKDVLEKAIKEEGVSADEYEYFLIKPDILEVKVYEYLITTFKDERGVLKIQEAYALLESEEGDNWDDAASQYGEDATLAENSFWLSEEELVDAYESIAEVEEGGFSKITQVPIGYVIWHIDSISKEEEKIMREIRGLFVYSQTMDDFFNAYLENVNIKKIY